MERAQDARGVNVAAETRFDLEKAHRLLPLSKLCESADLPSDRAPRLLSAQAFAPTLETSFSGSTFYLALAGLSTRNLEGCFSLYSGQKPLKAVQARGALWKLLRLIQRQKSSGFKFTGTYADEVWPRYIGALAGCTIISNFQVYGREFLKRRKALAIRACFYIDGTLADYFGSYGGFEVDAIDPSTMKHAMELETEGYQQAEAIVTMSQVAARSLQEQYAVPAEKISVIVPGANLPDDAVEAADLAPATDQTKEFLIGFVGLYPLRKGLERLAAAVKILRERGLPFRLRVIGECPDDLARMDGIDFLGRINKSTDLNRFLQAIAGVHLGCLVPKSELAGIAFVEFLRLGVPILGTRVGGASDILNAGGSIGVSAGITIDELAEILAQLYHDPDSYRKLKREAEVLAGWASWRRVANELDAVLP